MNIQVKIAPDSKKFYNKETLLPKTPGSAAIDLCFLDDSYEDGEWVIFTGLSIYIKDSKYVGLVVPRSGNPIQLRNTVGIIDSDYQGEILLKVNNIAEYLKMVINPGTRIAQLLIVPVIHPKFIEVDAFSEKTLRGKGKFGSTGK